MKIIKEKFKEDARRNYYWGRIYFISDNRAHKTRVLWGITRLFAQEKLGKENIEKDDIERIANAIVNKWKEERNSIFLPNFRYDGYATNPEEKSELLAFLRENDKV